MAIQQTGYRDPAKAMTIKALQDRQKAAQAATASTLGSVGTTVNADPLSAVGNIAQVLAGGLNESRAARQEGAARGQLAEIMAGIDPEKGATMQQIAAMQQLDPDFANKEYERAMAERAAVRRQEDQQAFTSGESQLERDARIAEQERLFGQQDKTQAAGFTHDTAQQEDQQAAAAAIQEDTQAATAAQNELTRQADIAKQKMADATAAGRQEDQQAAAQELSAIEAELAKQKTKSDLAAQTANIGPETAAREVEADRLKLPPGPERDEFVLTGKYPAKGVEVNNYPGGNKLDEAMGTKEGEMLIQMQQQGNVAASSKADFEMLSELGKVAWQGPISGQLKNIPFLGNFASAGKAFDSIVKRVAPTLRVEGSGSTSDREYNGMLDSLPKTELPEATNRMIVGMMQAKVQIDMERAQAVTDYQNSAHTREDQMAMRAKLQEINQRSVMTPELQALKDALVGEVTGTPDTGDGAWKIEEATP